MKFVGVSLDFAQPSDVLMPIAELVPFFVLPTSALVCCTRAFPILPAVLPFLLSTSFARVAFLIVSAFH